VALCTESLAEIRLLHVTDQLYRGPCISPETIFSPPPRSQRMFSLPPQYSSISLVTTSLLLHFHLYMFFNLSDVNLQHIPIFSVTFIIFSPNTYVHYRYRYNIASHERIIHWRRIYADLLTVPLCMLFGLTAQKIITIRARRMVLKF
jgi:hypothetical protein